MIAAARARIAAASAAAEPQAVVMLPVILTCRLSDGHCVEDEVRHSDSLCVVVDEVAAAMTPPPPANNSQCRCEGVEVLPRDPNVSFGMCGIPWRATVTVNVEPGWGRQAGVSPYYDTGWATAPPWGGSWADASGALACVSGEEFDEQIRVKTAAVGRAAKTYEQAVRASAESQEAAGALETLRRLQLEVMAAIDAKDQWATSVG